MRKILLLPLVLMIALTMQAEVTHLRIEMASGGESISSLEQIGKIVLGEDNMVLYNKSGAEMGSTPYSQVDKIVFYEDGNTMSGIDDVASPAIQVIIDQEQETILVKGIHGDQTIRVFSVSGQLLQSVATAGGEANLYVGGLQNGTYLLQVGAQVMKFIKEPVK